MSKKQLIGTYFGNFDKMTVDYAEELYQRSLGLYDDQIKKFEKYYNMYHSPGTNGDYDKNMVFELLESEIDNNIYYPQVRSLNGKIEAAKELEEILKNELHNHRYREFNDQQERNTYIFGGSVTLVYWDRLSREGYKGGKIAYKAIDPRNFIPQHGINKIEDMDYCFIVESATKMSIANLYNLNVNDMNFAKCDNDMNIDPDLITIKTIYYKDKYNHVCRFTWSGQLVLEDDDNIYDDKQFVCSKCNTIKDADEDTCVNCGNNKYVLKSPNRRFIEFTIEMEDGKKQTITENVTPFVPNRFPIIIRQNISSDKLFGVSDVEMIETSQLMNNRVMNKLADRILKSGSLIAIPKTLRNKFKVDNSELKILYYDNPAEAQGIMVQNLQPSMGNETVLLDMSYSTARQTLGITNTFQGREDNSAISSRAKEIQVQQTVGRLESKREMKKSSLINLFEMMFQFILAYSDEYKGYYIDRDGQIEYKVYDNRLFLQKTEKGKWYYDDEYMFDIDLSATYELDRQKMWEETRNNFASGTYGDPQDPNTLVMFWQMMYKEHYPGAKEALDYAKLRQQQLMLQQQMDRMMQERQLQLQASAQRSQDMVNEQTVKTARNKANAEILNSMKKK